VHFINLKSCRVFTLILALLSLCSATTIDFSKTVGINYYFDSNIVNRWVKNETGRNKAIQLYNLKEDKSQQHNLASQYPEMVKEMLQEIAEIKNN